ncbi:MAG: tyrosine-type recombinase/integrase [Ghiorsea sp.]
MKLTDSRVKTAKLEQGTTKQKLSDIDGLYLLLNKSGKYWRYDYRFAGKRKTYAIGVYPSVSLKQARLELAKAKKLLAENIDPNQSKQAKKRKQYNDDQATTFKGVAYEWIKKQAPTWAPSTLKSTQSRLERHILPWLGSLPIKDIEAIDVLSVARRVEQKGNIELAHRIKRLCGQILRYAVATCRITSDPSRDLQGALAPVVTKHRACIKTPKQAGELMRSIQGFTGTHITACALRLSPYVFLRPAELRKLEWQFVDFEKARITIPAENMKMKSIHIVPLSFQAIAILKDVQALTGNGKYVFHGARATSRPMSENTINACLQRLGYSTTHDHCAHGFRGMASTLLYEQGYQGELIERQLAHSERNRVKAAYNHAEYLKERTAMMQAWANYLDAFRDGAEVIPIKRNA